MGLADAGRQKKNPSTVFIHHTISTPNAYIRYSAIPGLINMKYVTVHPPLTWPSSNGFNVCNAVSAL